MFIIAQLVGVVGLLMAILSFQQNVHKKIMLFQLLTGGVFTIHFLLLGAYTGAALNFIGALRGIILTNREKSWAKSFAWMPAFLLIYIVAGILTWENTYSLLPIIACLLYTVSFWLKEPKNVRRLTLPASPLWMIYNAANASYAGVITELFVLSSIIVGMVRFDACKKVKIAP